MYVCFYCMYVYIVLVGKDEPIVKMLLEAEVKRRESKVDKLVATVVESAKQAEIERVASLRGMGAQDGHNSDPSPVKPIVSAVATVTPLIIEPQCDKGKEALMSIMPNQSLVDLSPPTSPTTTSAAAAAVKTNRRRRISNTNKSNHNDTTDTVGTSGKGNAIKGTMSNMSRPGEQTLCIEDIDNDHDGHNYDLRAASFVE